MLIDIETGGGDVRVSSVLADTERCDALMVFAHGAGAGMQHAFMNRMAEALLDAGIATLRFQFPYMERGRKPPDRQPVLVATIARVAAVAATQARGRPLFVGGKSMGGRMASIAAAEGLLPDVQGLVFFGFPLHPAGKASTDRADHLAAVAVPMLFLQGTRDRLADPGLIEAVCADLGSLATLQKFVGADHSFAYLKSAGRTDAAVDAEIAAAVRAFVTAVGATTV
tara:strand:+ start:1063 stop:1740 length:678 start_codon:yes stop_codon:yes gene_type:complete